MPFYEDTVRTQFQGLKRAFVSRGAWLLAACILMIQPGFAADTASITLIWDPSSDSSLAGYYVYRAEQSGAYSSRLNGLTPLTSTTFTDSSAIPGTVYYYIVRSVNTSGLESGPSNEAQVLAPSTSTAPVVVLNSPLTPPTGAASSCSIDGKTFTVRWNSVAGAENYYLRVDYLANNTGTTWVVDGNDHYLDRYTGTSYTAPVISGKAYSWWVHAANASEGIGPDSWGTFTCNNTTAPSNLAPVVSAGSSQTLTLPATTTLTATATDDGLPSGTLTYHWSVNNASGVALTNASSRSAQASFSAAGTYVFTVTVSDGQLTSTANVSVVVKAANSALTAPTGLTSSCSTDGKTFTVRWNSVAGADNYYLRVDYLANNTADNWNVASSDHYLDQYTGTSFTAPVISGKAYIWWVHPANTAEGIGPVASGSFTCNNDVVPPTVTITNPAKGVPVSGNTISVSASASDNVGVVGVQFKINGANLGIEDTSAPYSASWDTKKLPQGTYTLQAIARDAAGNKATSTATATAKIQKGKTQITVSSLQSDSDVATLQSSQAPAGPSGPQVTASSDGAIVTIRTGDIVVSEAAIATSAPLRNGRVYVHMEEPVSTGLAIVNRQSQAAVISFFFTDGSGNDFAHGSFTLEGNRQITGLVNQEPFKLSAAMEGTFTFSSSVPVNVAGFRKLSNERGEVLLTALPAGEVGEASRTPVFFPGVFQGGGWTSQFILTNPSDAPLTGTIRFFNQKPGGTSGTPMLLSIHGKTDSMFDYTVAPRSVTRIVIDSADADLHVGYAVVTPTGNTVAPRSLLALSLANQEVTVSSTGVPGMAAGAALRTYFETSQNVSLGLAIANQSSSPALVTLEPVMSTGESTGLKTTVSIPPMGHLSKFINEVLPGFPGSFKGRLMVTSTQPVAMSGFRVRRNERGDFLYTAMPVMNEADTVAGGSEIVLPLTLTGGGSTTEFFSIR